MSRRLPLLRRRSGLHVLVAASLGLPLSGGALIRDVGAASPAPAPAVATAATKPSLFEQAKERYQKDGPKAALPLFEAALRTALAAGDARAAAVAEGAIGNCHKRLGDYPRALRHFKTALAAQRRLRARLDEGKTLSNLGLLEWEKGNHAAALRWFDQALRLAHTLDEASLEAAVLNNVALVLDEQGNFASSREHYARALEIERRTGDREAENATLGNIGGAHYFLGDFREGISWYEKSLALSRELGRVPSEGQDLGNLALGHIALDEAEEALKLLKTALHIARAAGLKTDEADWLRYRGGALLLNGDISDALQSYGEALAIYQQTGMKREELEARIDLARVRLQLGETLASRDQLNEALALAESLGQQSAAIDALTELGRLHRRTGDTEQSLKAWERALARAHAIGHKGQEAILLELIGRSATDLGRAERAKAHFGEGLALARRQGLRGLEASILQALAEQSRRAGSHPAAIALYDQGIAVITAITAPEIAWPLHHGRGRAFEALGRRDEAVASYRQAIAEIESVRGRLRDETLRSAYLGERADVYADLACLLLEQHEIGAAFQAVESFRARAHLDRMSAGPRPAAPKPSGRQRERERELRKKIERLSQELATERAQPSSTRRALAIDEFGHELARSEREYTLLLADLGESDPPYATLVSAAPVSLARVRSALAPDEAMIEYFLFRGRLHAFVLRPDRLELASQPLDREELEASLKLLRDRVGRGTDDWHGIAEELWDVLVRPSLAHLGGVRTLYLVPQDPLLDLPFALLRASEAVHPYLIERYDLAYLPSAAALALTRRGPRAPGSRALALAPASGGLAHVAAEVHDVQRALGTAELLVGAEATERALKQKIAGCALLHLATHGHFNHLNPLFSLVALEPGAGEDGRLYAHEILNLPIVADLVTLSACDTALVGGRLGRAPSGDDVMGLTQAFLQAGARSVVATMWPVDDRATNELMRRFYGHLGADGKAAALAHAQREVLRSRRDVPARSWAGFVLFGDGG